MVAAALLLYLPKYAAAEMLLKKLGATTTADRVEEGLTRLSYLNGTLFLPEGLKVEFKKISINLMPPSAELICKGEGIARLSPDGLNLRAELKNLRCLSFAKEVEGELLLTPAGEVFGRLNLRGAAVKNLNLESANFTFNGYTFSGRIRAFGRTIEGGGRIRIFPTRGVYLNATFEGGGVRFRTEGFLPRPKVGTL
jgi:hypothetical protein